MTILRHLHRCPKVKTNFATCPKLLSIWSRTRLRTKICPKIVLGHVLVLKHFREHDT